jgi:hypothetical protein
MTPKKRPRFLGAKYMLRCASLRCRLEESRDPLLQEHPILVVRDGPRNRRPAVYEFSDRPRPALLRLGRLDDRPALLLRELVAAEKGHDLLVRGTDLLSGRPLKLGLDIRDRGFGVGAEHGPDFLGEAVGGVLGVLDRDLLHLPRTPDHPVVAHLVVEEGHELVVTGPEFRPASNRLEPLWWHQRPRSGSPRRNEDSAWNLYGWTLPQLRTSATRLSGRYSLLKEE